MRIQPIAIAVALSVALAISGCGSDDAEGFLEGEPRGNDVSVSFYSDDSEPASELRAFELMSSPGSAGVDLPVEGVSKLIVRFAAENKDRTWRAPEADDPSFSFRSPVFE